jgi:hypothetical protein
MIRACSIEVLRTTPSFANVRGVTEQMTENLTHLEGGWVLWSRSRSGTTEGLRVFAQLLMPREGGPSEVVRLTVEGRNLTADKLRTIPLGHIEAAAKANPDFSPHIEGQQDPIGEGFDVIRRQANGHILAKARRKARKPLTRPDGSNPDAFYQQVAGAYRDVIQDHRNVAVVLAKEADVPVGTVHRWIVEARRRGFLPAARVGRVG